MKGAETRTVVVLGMLTTRLLRLLVAEHRAEFHPGEQQASCIEASLARVPFTLSYGSDVSDPAIPNTMLAVRI